MADQGINETSALTEVLFEKTGLGFCLVGPDGTVVRANAEWLRSTGFTEEQVVGKDIIGLFPETREAALAMHASARAGRRVEVPRHARVIGGRETRWEGSIEPVPMEGGTGLLITAREIASSTAAAELQAVLDAVPAAVFIAHDPEARRLGTNRAAFEMLRVAPGENVSKSAPPEEAPTYRVFRDGVEVPTEELPVQVAAARGVEVRDWDCEIRFEDGTSRYLLANATPIRDESGAPAGSVSAFVDITERKQAEEALRSSEERYRTLYEGTRDGVVLVDMRGRILDCNDAYCQMLGHAREELRAMTYMELTPERWHAFEAATVRDQLLPRGYSEIYEKEYRRKDGTVFPVELRTKLLCDRAGRPTAAWGLVRDITGRKRAEEVLLRANQQLKEAARRKDEFLAMLSHELRNPLAPLRNSTYVLTHAEPGSDEARRAQAVIERQIEHLTHIVDDLLDVTRITHGKVELRRERVEVGGIVRRAAEDYRRMVEDRGVALRIALPEGGTWADADPTRVTQIVGNLVHNAAKFTDEGEIVVSAQPCQGAIEIRVRDGGVGIAPELLPHLFGAFVQGDRTLARSEGGLGLGLALVKGLAELHGGSVRAESAGVGKGAEFIVSLPLARESGEVARRPAASPKRQAPRRVLVVDDNHDAAESLADIVQMLGHAAEVAFNGPKTIEKARANPPDVVLCDVGLPGMSGYEVAKALREALGSNVQLFAVTGYAQPDDVKRAIEAGFDGHVAKPCDPVQIERLLS